MKLLNKLFCTLIISLSVVACATSHTPLSKAKPVPKERLLAFQDKTPQTTSTIVITRDNGLTGAACYKSFSINKILAARIAPSETATFYVKPEEIVLGLDAGGLCQDSTNIETVMHAEETKYFRLYTSSHGGTQIMRSDKY